MKINLLVRNFGKNLIEIMDKKGITIKDLEASTGIDRAAIYGMRKQANPTMFTLYRLAQGLKCEVSDLLPKMDEL